MFYERSGGKRGKRGGRNMNRKWMWAEEVSLPGKKSEDKKEDSEGGSSTARHGISGIRFHIGKQKNTIGINGALSDLHQNTKRLCKKRTKEIKEKALKKEDRDRCISCNRKYVGHESPDTQTDGSQTHEHREACFFFCFFFYHTFPAKTYKQTDK